MEVEEEHSPFDLEASSPPANLHLSSGRPSNDSGEPESKPSEVRPSTDGNDLDQLMNDLNKRQQLAIPLNLQESTTHQWIFMVEVEIEEIRLVLERLFPEASKDGGDSDPILRLIRRAER